MVTPRYANLDIEFWEHQQKLGFSEPALCLFHDKPQAGTPILDALKHLRTLGCPAKTTLTFAPSNRQSALAKLSLLFVPLRAELRVMNIRREAQAATIETTDQGLDLLIKALARWLDGTEDFCVGPRHSDVNPQALGALDRSSGELWFWGPGYTGP